MSISLFWVVLLASSPARTPPIGVFSKFNISLFALLHLSALLAISQKSADGKPLLKLCCQLANFRLSEFRFLLVLLHS